MLPIADGSDMGGSLRNPASFCNVVGLRPSPGRVPVWPAAAAWSTLSVDGPMARTVADVALMLSAIAGPDPRSPIAIDEPGEPVRRAARARLQGRADRLVEGSRRRAGRSPRPRCRRRAARACSNRSAAVVEEAEPDFTDFDAVFKTVRALAFLTGVAPRIAGHRDR